MDGWQKLLLAAGGAAAVGTALYYLLREDAEAEAALLKQMGGADGGLTKEMLIEVLQECVSLKDTASSKVNMVAKQVGDKMKEAIGEAIDFDVLYQMVSDSGADDANITAALKKRGLTTTDLDYAMQKYQTNPEVLTLCKSLFDPRGDAEKPAAPKELIAPARLVEIYQTMVEALAGFVTKYENIADKSKYDFNLIMMCAQVSMDALVHCRCGVEKQEIESSCEAQQAELIKNTSFMQTQSQISQKMESLFRYCPRP
eukprot:TRINITY_DN100509_c0_g1_i1.p1 TRINITY_DN100509_c0_g1~~TRINITY_DN100509_c0_g1_i1.p1  ORF type:complete len:290 (-),score=74.95 TRINITY_DN100509_c0_g1_i1:180-950(-)